MEIATLRRTGGTAEAPSRRRVSRALRAGVAVVMLIGSPGLALAQEAHISGSDVSISSGPERRAQLQLQFSDGSRHEISLQGGSVQVDGGRIATYVEGGALESAWREFLRLQAGRSAEELGRELREWDVPGVGSEREAADALRAGLDRLLGVRAAAPTGARAESITGPDGTQLSIAPGSISIDALTEQLDRLRLSLESLGDAAATRGATDHLALIVHDDYTLAPSRTVPGNLALLDGRLEVEGTVEGDVLVLNGTLALEPSGRVQGDILQVGGAVEQEGGLLEGELLSVRPVRPPARDAGAAVGGRGRSEAGERPARRIGSTIRVHRSRGRGLFGGIAHNLGHALGATMSTLSGFLVLGILGLVAVYFRKTNLEVVADTVRDDFGRSFAVGVAGEVLFFPILLILAVLVITLLVVPFFLLGTALAIVLGYLAVAHAAGEWFAMRRYRYEWLERLRRSNSYYYVLSGLALLLAPFALAGLLWIFGGFLGFLRGLVIFVAIAGTCVLTTAGFGAVLITRGGTRRSGARRATEWSPAAPMPDEPAGRESAGNV
ncbi:MAG: hypothetical protein ACE5HQ_05075 [Gemmatimonadota bacterium]